MAWQIEGTYFETCSCEVVCPCTASLALGADYDRCRVTLVFRVASGDVEGTETIAFFVACCIFPGAFAPLAWIFAAACWITTATRVLSAWRMLGA